MYIHSVAITVQGSRVYQGISGLHGKGVVPPTPTRSSPNTTYCNEAQTTRQIPQDLLLPHSVVCVAQQSPSWNIDSITMPPAIGYLTYLSSFPLAHGGQPEGPEGPALRWLLPALLILCPTGPPSRCLRPTRFVPVSQSSLRHREIL